MTGRALGGIAIIFLMSGFFGLIGINTRLWSVRKLDGFKSYFLLTACMLINMVCQFISNLDRPSDVHYSKLFTWFWLSGHSVQTAGIILAAYFLMRRPR